MVLAHPMAITPDIPPLSPLTAPRVHPRNLLLVPCALAPHAPLVRLFAHLPRRLRHPPFQRALRRPLDAPPSCCPRRTTRPARHGVPAPDVARRRVPHRVVDRARVGLRGGGRECRAELPAARVLPHCHGPR